MPLLNNTRGVLFSVRPEWNWKIATGEKNVEVRKKAPNIQTPYKGFLYCTDGKTLYRSAHDGEIRLYKKKAHKAFEHHTVFNCKVWAEFICDADIPLLFECSDPAALVTHYEVPGTCLSDVEIMEYLGNGKQGHGLHISGLTIYDKPRELAEFRRVCGNDLYCESCAMYNTHAEKCGNAALHLHRPPQSWCYVEEIRP